MGTWAVTFLVRKGASLRWQRVGDIAGAKIGTRLGFRYPLIDTAQGVWLEAVETDEQNVRKLAAGRLDAVIVGSIQSLPRLRANPEFSAVFDVLPRAAGRAALSIAFNKARVSQDEFDRFNTELAKYLDSPDWRSSCRGFGDDALLKAYPVLDP